MCRPGLCGWTAGCVFARLSGQVTVLVAFAAFGKVYLVPVEFFSAKGNAYIADEAKCSIGYLVRLLCFAQRSRSKGFGM